MQTFEPARRVVDEAIARRVFPAAALEVGTSDCALWRDARGTLTCEPGSAPAAIDTPFDLASLTKPIATTSIALSLVADGVLRLDERVAAYSPEWRGGDRERVTIRELLEHASGLPARLVDRPPATRREFEHEICAIRLEYQPGTQSIYSDLGFILLGFVLADRGGAPLASQFDRMMARLEGASEAAAVRHALTFSLAPDLKERTAPTRPLEEDARRGRMLAGEVHDNYAAALGGAAGHSGLFGTSTAVGAFARLVLRSARGEASVPEPLSPAIVALMTAKSTVPGSSRALGWDTMLPTSSCGTRMSPSAFGHVGFTGTSLWIDPTRDRYFVLLTNRAAGNGTLADMRTVRRAFHDALGDL